MADVPERRHLPDYWRHFVDSTVEPNENFPEVLEQFAGRLDGDRFEEAWGGSRDKAYQDEENLINSLAILTDYLREIDGYKIGVDPELNKSGTGCSTHFGVRQETTGGNHLSGGVTYSRGKTKST